MFVLNIFREVSTFSTKSSWRTKAIINNVLDTSVQKMGYRNEQTYSFHDRFFHMYDLTTSASNAGPSQSYEEMLTQPRNDLQLLHVSCYSSVPKEHFGMHLDRWSNYQIIRNTPVVCTVTVTAIHKQNEIDSIDVPLRERMLCLSAPNADSV